MIVTGYEPLFAHPQVAFAHFCGQIHGLMWLHDSLRHAGELTPERDALLRNGVKGLLVAYGKEIPGAAEAGTYAEAEIANAKKFADDKKIADSERGFALCGAVDSDGLDECGLPRGHKGSHYSMDPSGRISTRRLCLACRTFYTTRLDCVCAGCIERGVDPAKARAHVAGMAPSDRFDRTKAFNTTTTR